MEPRLIRPPFVLLEDLEGGTATLFERPSEAHVATTAAEVTSAIGRADQLIEAGRTMAGWIGYEAGYALEPRLHARLQPGGRSEEHTSELQSLMRTSYAVFCLKKKTPNKTRMHSIRT